ncbi:hypothetical protein M408DRAFT_29741 [Serendipita vermifera MAFF 305830]|uniref:Uncharacterized protein n=1 Tax=Serendipita vermifera MAFF 305830 TaxID=933852 RepID=A0A0C3APM8_SERVB|nr:hypothetical protein M408DRAFT_29741 [Serendipita vermifera MAFF 305830]
MYSNLLSFLLVIPLIAAIPVPLGAEFLSHDEAKHANEKTQFDEALGAGVSIPSLSSLPPLIHSK